MRFRNLLCVLLVAASAACAAGERSGPVAVVDALGHRVALQHPAQRIVSLAPATTELLFALGAGPRVVGRTRWCDYPAEVASVTSVGDGLNPNVEAVAAQKPDLVVMYATSANDPAVEQFARLGIAAVNLPMDKLSDVSRSARLLGVLLGDSAHAESIAFAFDSTLTALRTARRIQGPSVVMVVWDNPPMVIGAGSFMSELVELAGSWNVFGDLPQPSATVSIETIAARKPDVILVHGEAAPAWAARPEWRTVPAIRAKRFVYLHGSASERPSLRAPRVVEELAVALLDSR